MLEVFEPICLLLAEEYLTYKHPLLSLRDSCKAMRDLLEDMHVVWATVRLSIPEDDVSRRVLMKLLKGWIARAGEAPLDYLVEYKSQMYHDKDHQLLRNVFTMLCERDWKCVQIYLKLQCKSKDSIQLDLRSFTSLKALDLYCSGTSLVLTCPEESAISSSSTACLTKLTELDLGCCIPERIGALLSLCPNLQRLSLCNQDTMEREVNFSSPINLDHLTYLQCTSDMYSASASKLFAPKLEEVWYIDSLADPESTDVFEGFLEWVTPELKILKIYDLENLSSRTAFKKLKSLTEFRAIESNTSIDFIYSLKEEGEDMVLPSVEKLSLSPYGDDSYKRTLSEMLAFRYRYMKNKGKEFEAEIMHDDGTFDWFTGDLLECIIDGFHLIIVPEKGPEVTALQLAMDRKVIERNDDLLQ